MSPESQAELLRRYPNFFRKPGKRLCKLGTSDAGECLDFEISPFDERGIECGDGWFVIIDRLSFACEKEIVVLISRGVNQRLWPRVAQIKEKLGGLRFYVKGSLSPHLRRQILKAEANDGESYRTCECCGAVGRLRDGAWKRTLCNGCDADDTIRRRE